MEWFTSGLSTYRRTAAWSWRTGPLRAGRPLRGVYTFSGYVVALVFPLAGIEITPVSIETSQLAFVGGGAVGAGDGDVVEAEVDA